MTFYYTYLNKFIEIYQTKLDVLFKFDIIRL